MHLSNSCGHLSVNKTNNERVTTRQFAFLDGLSMQLCRMFSTSYERSLWLKDKLAKLLVHTEKEKATPKTKKMEGNIDPRGEKGKSNKG